MFKVLVKSDICHTVTFANKLALPTYKILHLKNQNLCYNFIQQVQELSIQEGQ